MKFIDKAPLYQIIRITGPKHNLLGIQLSEQPSQKPLTIEILNPDTKDSDPLRGNEVAEQVMLGIEQASSMYGKPYFVEKIQYLTTDSLPIGTYKDLTLEIIRRVQTGDN